jgi:hypothetical protein
VSFFIFFVNRPRDTGTGEKFIEFYATRRTLVFNSDDLLLVFVASRRNFIFGDS